MKLKKRDTMKTKSVLLETILVTIVTLLGMWFLPAYKTIFALLPPVYLLVERRLRHRTWGDLGFKFRSFRADLRANWLLFALTGFFIQPLTVLWAKAYFPEFLVHVQARLPFESGIGWGTLLPLLATSLLGEELTYRTLIQGKLTLFIGAPAAVGVASLLFGLAHFAPGSVLIVGVDIGLIVINSILYGMIFARCNNLWVVWMAHLLGDILGLMFLAAV